MRRSYFIPMLLLGSVLLATGLYGLRANRIALEDYDAESHHYVRRDVKKVDSKTLINSLTGVPRLRYEHVRLHAFSATFVGLVFIVWAFDRRSAYVRVKAAGSDQATGSVTRATTQIRSIAFCGLLVLFAIGSMTYMREIVPDWVDHVRSRSLQRKNERVRAFLEENGIPGAQVHWGGGKGGRGMTLTGPEVKDISALADLPVTWLTLRDTQVTDLGPLRKCPLYSLRLQGSPVIDIAPLAGSKISFLDLTDTNVSNLQALAHMPRLQTVHLSRQQIMGNLEVLRNLKLRVREVPEGPSIRTGSPGWQSEYETVDANSVQLP